MSEIQIKNFTSSFLQSDRRGFIYLNIRLGERNPTPKSKGMKELVS